MILLLLTKFYPYGTGEAFIENEINVLSKHYEKIIIIACEASDKDSYSRKVPNNTIVYKVPAKHKIKDLFYGITKYMLSSDKELCEEYLYCANIIQRIFLSYFEEKSQRIFSHIISHNLLEEIKGKEYVLYSYWMFTTARVGTLISKMHKPIYMFTRAHRYDLYDNHNSIGYLPFRHLFLERFNAIYPCSADGTEYLCNLYPRYANKIETKFLGTINHGVGKRSDDGIFRIVSCSRIAPEKRVDKIIESLALLDSKHEDIQWIHIGGGKGLSKLKRVAFKKLKNISFGKIEVIGERAFKNCNSLTSLTFSSNLKNINEDAFLDCKNLTKVEFLGSLQLYILERPQNILNCFKGTNLEEIIFANIESAFNFAITNCPNLKKIYVSDIPDMELPFKVCKYRLGREEGIVHFIGENSLRLWKKRNTTIRFFELTDDDIEKYNLK